MSQHLTGTLCACCTVYVVGLFFFLGVDTAYRCTYQSILVLSEESGFRGTLSYFRRQQIVLGDEVKRHTWG